MNSIYTKEYSHQDRPKKKKKSKPQIVDNIIVGFEPNEWIFLLLYFCLPCAHVIRWQIDRILLFIFHWRKIVYQTNQSIDLMVLKIKIGDSKSIDSQRFTNEFENCLSKENRFDRERARKKNVKEFSHLIRGLVRDACRQRLFLRPQHIESDHPKESLWNH